MHVFSCIDLAVGIVMSDDATSASRHVTQCNAMSFTTVSVGNDSNPLTYVVLLRDAEIDDQLTFVVDAHVPKVTDSVLEW